MKTAVSGILLMAASALGDAVIKVNETLKPFPNQNCVNIPFAGSCDCNTVIKGAAVHIKEGFHNGDILSCTKCSSLGITVNFSGDEMQLSDERTIEQYATALSSVVFTPAGVGSRVLVLNYGHGLFSRKNHHFYRFFSGNVSWQEAQISCASRDNDILGLPGYLITITSQEEQNIVKSKLTGRGWMGASDAGVEREWRWVVGPEGCPPYDLSVDGFERTACPMGVLQPTFQPCDSAICGGLGTLFGIQRSDRPGLIAEPGMYNNFKSDEPNEFRGTCPGLCTTAGEDYAQFFSYGFWNDYPLIYDIEGYMCEWGDIAEACMPNGYISQAVVLHDTCPPSAPMSASIIKPNRFTVDFDGNDVTVGMPAWTNAMLTKLPKYLTETNGQVVQAFSVDTLVSGSAIRMKCPFSCDDKPCDIYVTHYLCPPCKNENGGLPSLLSDGWQAGSCAPRFMENNDGFEHSMVAFRRRIASGEEIDLPFLTSDLSKFVVFGVSQIMPCQNANDATECDAISGCSWKNGVCAEDWCSVTFQKTGTKIEVSRKSPGDAETLTLGSGDVVVGWYSSADHQLQARIYKNSNPTVAGDVIVVHQSSAESTTVFASGRKQLAALSDGGFLITYQENDELYRRQYTSTGRPVGGAVLIATIGATPGRHSAVGFRTGGGAVVLFSSTGGSFRMFSLAANSLTPVTVLGTSVTFYDMIEISAGLLVVFSEGTSELFYKVLSSVGFAELSSGTIAGSPTRAWDRISLKMSHGRETPLITLAAHDSVAAMTTMRTWLFTDDIAVSTPTMLDRSTVLDHLTLGMGSSNKGQTILFSSTGFAYYNNDYSDISFSGFRSSLAVSETLTKVSVAQLGVNGWFAVFPSQTAEEVPVPIIAASYYHVPEVQFVTDIELDAMSSCRLDNGGYAVAYRTNAGAVMYALFDDDNNMKSKKTIGTGATTAPIIAGSLPHSNTFFVTYGDGGIRSVEVDATGDGTEQTALVQSGSSDHRSFLCGGSLVVIVSSVETIVMFVEMQVEGTVTFYVLTAFVGGSNVRVLSTGTPFIWDSACGAGGTYYVTHVLDGTRDVNYVPITGTTIGSAMDFLFNEGIPGSIRVFTPTRGNLLIFIVDRNSGDVHSRSITSSVTWRTSLTCFRDSLTFSQSLYDESFSVSCASNMSLVKDRQGGAIMFTRMEATGAEIEPSRVVNNFVIGTQANPSMIATDKGVVIVYATATTSITGDPIGVSLLIEVDAGYERQPETASNTLRGFQRSPASCGFSGGAVVVWESHVGAVSQIYAQIYDTTGRAIFDKEFMVSGGTSAPEDRPDVACFSNNFYVSWQSAVGSSTTINVLQFASNGDKIGSPVLIHTIATGGDARPVIATTTSGNKYVVSWQANLGTGNDVDVYMSVVEGSAISDPIIVHGTLQLTQRNPSVDITDDDSVIIAWQSFNEDGSGYGIFARVFDVSQANPVASAAAFQVNTETEGSQTSPRVAFFSDKKFIIIWGSGTLSTLFNVMGAVYSAGAVKQGSDFRVNAEEIGNDRPTSICILPDDSFIVAWNRFEIRLTQDAYFRRFDTSGRPLGGDQLINKFTRRRQFDATIALLHNDNFFISWTSKWQDRSSWSIYSSAYSRVPTVTTYGVPDQSSIAEQVVKPLSDGRVLSLYIVQDDSNVARLIGEVENTDGTSFGRDILQLTNIGLGSTYDVTVVGTTAYVVVHDGGDSFTYKIISFEISASTLSSPVVVASFVAINEAAVYPKISIDSGTTLIHVLHRDGNNVGNNLYLESFDTNGGGVNKVSLFPRMNSFTHGSMSFLSSGYFVIANSMRRTTTTRLYLSVVKTDGNVAKTVALTTADEQLYSEVGILSDNRVVVCYALRNVDLIDCQIYKITLGTDVFIEKVGPTCKTFIYSSTRTIGMSVVGDDKFAVTGVSLSGESVYVKVLNSKFEVLEAYRAFSHTCNRDPAIASIAKFQESGLIVPMQVRSSTGRKLMWRLTSPVVTKIDSDVPTDESIPVIPN